MSRHHRILTGLLGAVCANVASVDARGQGVVAALDEYRSKLAWLEPYDSMLLSRRLTTQWEYEDREEGSANAKWLWNLRWAFLMGKNFAVGMQIEAPLRWLNEAGTESIGFGNIETRVGFVSRLSDTSRWGLSLNAKFPMTSSEVAGEDLFELRPIFGVRWDAMDWLELGLGLEYTFTPHDEGAEEVAAIDLKVPVVVKLADKLTGLISYNPRRNFANNSSRHRLELGVTRFFGIKNEYAVSIGGEIPLTDEALDWKGSIGFTWYFKN